MNGIEHFKRRARAIGNNFRPGLPRIIRQRMDEAVVVIHQQQLHILQIGVRLRDLLSMAGAPPGAAVNVESLERHGAYRVSFVDHFQAADPDTLLATHLDGQVLDLDHGYPLRLIGPDRPGVNQTKWVTKVTVL